MWFGRQNHIAMLVDHFAAFDDPARPDTGRFASL
jgi:hypothetical protein